MTTSREFGCEIEFVDVNGSPLFENRVFLNAGDMVSVAPHRTCAALGSPTLSSELSGLAPIGHGEPTRQADLVE